MNLIKKYDKLNKYLISPLSTIILNYLYHDCVLAQEVYYYTLECSGYNEEGHYNSSISTCMSKREVFNEVKDIFYDDYGSDSDEYSLNYTKEDKKKISEIEEIFMNGNGYYHDLKGYVDGWSYTMKKITEYNVLD
jgi:hypothetical protein